MLKIKRQKSPHQGGAGGVGKKINKNVTFSLAYELSLFYVCNGSS